MSQNIELDIFGELMDIGGGWFPSSKFRLLKRALEVAISNRISHLRCFYNSFYTMYPGLKPKKKDGDIYLPLTLSLKRVLELLITIPVSPPPKFIRTLFLIKTLPYMPPGHNLLPLPWGLGGVVILKAIISGPFNYVEQNDYLKILSVCVWVNDRRKGDWLPPISFDY